MDVDKTLAELIAACLDFDTGVTVELGRVIDLVWALDGWLANDGYLPKRWARFDGD